MPLPLIPVAVALAAAAGGGVATGGSGLAKLRRAKRTVADKEAALAKGERVVHEHRVACERAFRSLGETKLTTMHEALVPFHAAFGKLKNVELTVETPADGAPVLDEVAVQEAGRLTISTLDALSGLGLLGGTAVAASVGTTQAVMGLATASTGTAISSLSGAAASNATLAWLGGGTLATGGGGVAAGTMVMTGVMTAPAMLVGGVFLHQKGRMSLAKAEQFAADADAAVAIQRESAAVLKAAARQADQARALLDVLGPRLARRAGWLEGLVDEHRNWDEFSAREQDGIRATVVLAVATSHLVHTPVVDESGALTRAIRKVCDEGRVVAGAS
jgi:hypothetical protein